MNNIMQNLFQSFEKESIPYLHFKSNTNLEESFMNKADFDVLVDKRRLLDVERIITLCNGNRHNPPHIGNYPGVDNWLVFDDNTGEIFHLHLHYQLATGKFLVKDYILPWEATFVLNSNKGPSVWHIYYRSKPGAYYVSYSKCIKGKTL